MAKITVAVNRFEIRVLVTETSIPAKESLLCFRNLLMAGDVGNKTIKFGESLFYVTCIDSLRRENLLRACLLGVQAPGEYALSNTFSLLLNK